MSPHRQARLLVAATRLLGALPWPVVYALGDGIAALWRLGDARESRVARRNLELAFPEVQGAERDALHRRILRERGFSVFAAAGNKDCHTLKLSFLLISSR